MGRVYATTADYQAYTGQAPDADTARRLARASEFLDAQVFRLAVFTADSAGMPTDPGVVAAFRDATCAQVEWWAGVGDVTGAQGAGYKVVRVGTAHVERSASSPTGQDSPARQVAPAVWDKLNSPDLVEQFRIGAQWTGLW